MFSSIQSEYLQSQNSARRSVIAYVLASWILVSPSLTWAAEYYVDQNHVSANDQNAGTITQPWRTITKANQTLVAGDTVYIRAGTYTSYIAPARSGTASG